MPRFTKFLLVFAIVIMAGSVIFNAFRPASAPLPPIGMVEEPCEAFDRTSDLVSRNYDWADLCHFEAENATFAWADGRPRIAMIGDSITKFWRTMDPAVVRRGISGQTSAQVLLRFRKDAVELDPDIAHILVGTNDIAGNTGPGTPDRIVANIASMADIARANGIRPILATVPPARDFSWAPDVPPNPWIDRLNAKIRDYAAREGLAMVDYHAVLVDDSGDFDASLFDDGAHPNKAGYARMEGLLDEAVRAEWRPAAGD